MHILIPVLIAAALIAVAIRMLYVNREKIHFFTEGYDLGFKTREIGVLWSLAKKCELENPIALYASVNELNRCIQYFITETRQNGTDQNPRSQYILDRLYKFRTRIALDKDDRRGLESTKSLDNGQRLRVILKGHGVFSSRIVNNGRELIISMPHKQTKKTNVPIVLKSEMWLGKEVSVYLWRKGDAMYVFDTTVYNVSVFRGETCLFLKHSYKLDRTQKRQSIRCASNIFADMYIISSSVIDYSIAETDPGYRCLIEDISEDGAMIRIGGKGKVGARIKLQFEISEVFVIMYGEIRAVEYNQANNESRLHLECFHIDPAMKNAILTFVYNVNPEQKDIQEAISEIESEEKDSSNLEIPRDENTVVLPVVPEESIKSALKDSLQEEKKQDEIKLPSIPPVKDEILMEELNSLPDLEF